MRSLWHEIRRDRGFYAVIALYGLTVLAIALAIDRTGKLSPLGTYLESWTKWTVFALILVIARAGAMSARGERTFEAMAAHFARMIPPSRAASLLLFLSLGFFHGLFTSMKTMLSDLAPFSFDPLLADLDAALHGGDAWQLIPQVWGVTRAIQYVYVPVWFALVGAVSAYATIFAPRELRDRFIWSYLACWIVLGTVIAGLMLSAGPCYYAEVTGSDRFAPMMAHLATTEGHYMSSFGIQKVLWEQYEAGLADFGSGISAFPSLHLAIPTLWTLLLWRVKRWLGVACGLFTALILIGSVHLGWHYAIDGYFSILFAVAVWKLIAVAQQRGARQELALA